MTPKSAVQKGFLLINLPILILWISLPILSYTVTKGKALPLYFVIGSLIGLLIFSWIWWSFSSMKWEIQSLSKVKNAHELYDRALKAMLIFPEHHFFQKHRWGSEKDKMKLQQLKQRMSIPDKFQFPSNAIHLKYDPFTAGLFLVSELFNFIFPILIGLFLMTNYSESNLFFKIGIGILSLTVVALFLPTPFLGKIQLSEAFSLVIKALQKKDAIIINQETIQLKVYPRPIPWEKIKNITLRLYEGTNLSSSGLIKFTFRENFDSSQAFHPTLSGIDWYLLQRIISNKQDQKEIKTYFQDNETDVNKG